MPLSIVDEKKKKALLGLVLLLAFLVYANTLLYGFVYDDHFQIEGNAYVHSFRYVGRIFTTTVWSFQGTEGQTNYYRPLMTFGYLLCNRAFQSSPIGFHLVNLLLNCAVVWLVYAVCTGLIGDEVVSLLAAALFALHPIHTEVVAWIAAVTELDLAVFYLCALLLFLRLEKEEGRRRAFTSALMCGTFVLALLSKEQGITLPVLATIYEHVYRADRKATTWADKFSRYGALWTIAAAYLVFRVTVLRAFAPVTQRGELSTLEVIYSGIALSGQYVTKLLWPHPLLGYYVFHECKSLGEPRVLLGIAALLLCLLLFVFLWRQAREYSFALVWIAVSILPVLNVRWMASSAFAERYLYLPSVAFCLLLAGGGMWLWRRAEGFRLARLVGAAAAIALAVLAAALTVTRNRDWRNDKSFFTATLTVDPHGSYMRTSLGALEWSEYRQQEAVKDWKLALADKPDNAIALSNLGMAMVEEKRWPEAEEYLRKAIELRPRFAAPHLHLGKMYATLERPQAAEREFGRAVEISPLSADARNQFGKYLREKGRLEEAEVQFRESLQGLPSGDAWNGLADILASKGLQDEAASGWKKTLELSPYDVHAHLGLGSVYQSRGSAGEAEKQYRAILLMDPHNEKALKAMRELNPTEFPAP
jgi:protein O-mannosyl-transferase